jgi:phosphodiesterase/alkaline phosphatase D-like protein
MSACLFGATSLHAIVEFTGVAAGDASSNEAIIWTRAVDPAASGPFSITAQVSKDSAFGTIVATSSTTPSVLTDNTIKFDVTGLAPGTRYYYRFLGPAGETSITGTFKCAPDAATAASVRFAFSGDCDGLMRPYTLTHDFSALGLDFFAFLGDTIYETASTGSAAAASTGTIPAPSAAGASPATLFADYSRKYREQFLPVNVGGQNCLQTFFASQGNYTLFDNHELGNKQYINGGAAPGGAVDGVSSGAGVDARDSANDVNTTGSFMNKAPGYQTLARVYLNYQPVKENRAGGGGVIVAPSDARTDGTPQLFFAQQWGKNAIYIHTDTRSYRDIRIKTAANADDTTAPRANNPNRTMLGATQLQWLKNTLLAAEAAHTSWKFVSVSDPIDQIGEIGNVNGFATPTLTGVKSDGGKSWIGGYRAERNALLQFIADNNIRNVVFLATDDHQNRINELLYSPTGHTEVQSSYVRVPSCFAIVDGPLGATGPETITDHSFANIKAIADDLAAHQTASSIDPIGLDPAYPGLHNVFRESDPNADVTRQAIDFYSPDTFNYTTFEIAADCPTLTVTTWGLNSYAVNTFPEASAANPVRRILSFQLDGDIEAPVIQSVTATPNSLWLPNHKMVPVNVSVAATDNCSIVAKKIVAVTSNESANRKGDGNTAVDWTITGDLSLELRAERSGNNAGRIYTITVEVTDQAGNKAQKSTTVTVPK